MVKGHAITWFEIPVTDIERSQKFYETIFEFQMIKYTMGESELRIFPHEGICGSLVREAGAIPARSGTRVYLNGGEDLNTVLSKVTAAGGKIVLEKTLITEEIGYFALFEDTEGNAVALHSKY